LEHENLISGPRILNNMKYDIISLLCVGVSNLAGNVYAQNWEVNAPEHRNTGKPAHKIVIKSVQSK